MSRFPHILPRALGLFVGLTIAVAIVQAVRVPVAQGQLGANLTITVAPHGEMLIEPTGEVLRARNMIPVAPGEADHASVKLTNRTDRRMMFRPVMGRQKVRVLNRRVRVRLEVDGKRLWGGWLADLRKGGARFGMRPKQVRLVTVRAWVPAGMRGHEARAVEATLGFRAARMESDRPL